MNKLIMNVTIAVFMAVPVHAFLLVDPGFESNPLTTAFNVLNNFATYQGQWGVEVAAIVGAENSITPAQGVNMLRMDDDGISWTQAFQATDVSAYAATIDAGGVSINAGALFNAHPHLSAALSNISVLFFSAANWGSQIGSPITSNLTLDALPNTWETNLAIGTLPVGTRWLITQVAFQNASLLGADGVMYPGYVDAADVSIKVPEPATLSLLGLGVFTLLGRRRR
jgi:hypothetical protein